MKLTVKLVLLALVAPAVYLSATVEIPPSPDVPHAPPGPWWCYAVVLGLSGLCALVALLQPKDEPPEDEAKSTRRPRRNEVP